MWAKLRGHALLIYRRIAKNPDVPLQPLPQYTRVLLDKLAPQGWWKRHLAAVQSNRVATARTRYVATRTRITDKVRAGGRLRVLFVVQSSSKWKCQTLFDLLRADERFEVLIGLSQPTLGSTATPRQLDAEMNVQRAFFTKRGCDVVDVYNPWIDGYADLQTLSPDIVFYPETWYQPPAHRPEVVARFALTYYIPYYVQEYGSLQTNCLLPIFQLYYRYIIQNEEWAAIFRAELAKAGHDLAGEIVGLGHPMLDLIRFAPETFDRAERLTVIYAPHWSVEIPGKEEPIKYATFEENGREILAYATRHPEIDWVFRPHPKLKSQLLNCTFMTADEVEAYYDAWSHLGLYSTGGGYEKVFDAAQVMITDCGSFLSEFGATGRPVIHLIAARNPLEPLPPSKRVFDTFYQVRDLEGLARTLQMVVEQRQDPLREKRLAALKASRLVGHAAGQQIHDAFVADFFQAGH